MSATKFFLIFLLLPVVLISLLSLTIYWNLWGKKQSRSEKEHKEQTKKLLTHIYNFSSVRLKNRTWQRSIGKCRKKSKKLNKSKNHEKK